MYDESIKLPILNNSTVLDYKCWNCVGTGKDKESKEVCGWCKGMGYILTDAGEAILNLVKRHVK